MGPESSGGHPKEYRALDHMTVHVDASMQCHTQLLHVKHTRLCVQLYIHPLNTDSWGAAYTVQDSLLQLRWYRPVCLQVLLISAQLLFITYCTVDVHRHVTNTAHHVTCSKQLIFRSNHAIDHTIYIHAAWHS